MPEQIPDYMYKRQKTFDLPCLFTWTEVDGVTVFTLKKKKKK